MKARPLPGLAMIAFIGSVALASCSSTQVTGSEIGALVPQILGIAILVWLIILIA